MNLISQKTEIDINSCKPGGTGPGKVINQKLRLSLNGIKVGKYRITCVPALYASELFATELKNGHKHIFAASHTHQLFMFDRNKPRVGDFDQVNFDKVIKGLSHCRNLELNYDSVEIRATKSPFTIYRRNDYPPSFIKTFICRKLGMFPNRSYKVDNKIYFFVFKNQNTPVLCIIYHALHPTTRSTFHASEDYVYPLRKGVAKCIGDVPILFFQGASGDIRCNSIKKIFPKLPSSKFNQRFEIPSSNSYQLDLDKFYFSAFEISYLLNCYKCTFNPFVDISPALFNETSYNEYILNIHEKLKFIFMPFEVAHEYHQLNIRRGLFIVGCSNDVYGYLPYPTQIKFGGYEVVGSLKIMGLRSTPVLQNSKIISKYT